MADRAPETRAPGRRTCCVRCKVAKDKGARVLGLSGFDGGALREMADVCITVPVDSTPQVESFHLALEHLMCDCLRQKIADA